MEIGLPLEKQLAMYLWMDLESEADMAVACTLEKIRNREEADREEISELLRYIREINREYRWDSSKRTIEDFYSLSVDFCNYMRVNKICYEDIDEILTMLLSLYITALKLPEMETEEEKDQVNREDSIIASFSDDFPSCYHEVFNPLKDEEAMMGYLEIDLSDITDDLRDGIKEYELGNVGNAVYEWRFGMRHHWGSHAVAAIKILHWIQNF